MTKRDCAIFLCGYIRGLISLVPNRKWEDEIQVHSVLRDLGCPEQYLPEKPNE
jgi:hypothetical protein